MNRKSLFILLTLLIAFVSITAPRMASADQGGPTPTPVSMTDPHPFNPPCEQLKDQALSGAAELWWRQLCDQPALALSVSDAPRLPSAPQAQALGPDVPVNNPAADGASGDATQNTSVLALNANTNTLCSAYVDTYHGFVENVGFVGFSRSANGGASFTDQGAIPYITVTAQLTQTNFGNPSLVWRRSDAAFYLTAVLGGDRGVGVWRSADDCQTFAFAGYAHRDVASYMIDDESILAVDNDPTSPHAGRLYAVWQGEYGQIQLSFSDDGQTWLAGGLTLSSRESYEEKVQTPWITVAPDGAVYVSWVVLKGDLSTPPLTYDIQVARSTDGGETFALQTLPEQNLTVPADPTSACKSSDFEPAQPALAGNIRYFPAPPQIVAGAEGALHIVYSYDPDGYNTGDVVNIYYRRSEDGGRTWTAEIRLNDDSTTTDQFFPTLSVSSNGRVVSTWYDRRNDPANNYFYETYMRVSYDNGRTWAASQKVSDAKSPVVVDSKAGLCYHGFYDQQLQNDDQVFIQWADDRNGTDANVWFEKVTVAPYAALSLTPAIAEACVNTSATYTLTATSVGGYASPITLTASGLPNGYSALFGNNPLTPTANTTVVLSGTGATAGNYTFAINGGDYTATAQLSLSASRPATPTLQAPANAATGVAALPTFSWGASARAERYVIEIAETAAFTQTLYRAETRATTHTPDVYLRPNTTYYWRVTAHNGCGNRATASASFTTRAAQAVLLVDNDDLEGVAEAYTATLTALGVTYDVWEVAQNGAPTETALAAYQTVLWYTGSNYASALNAATEAELTRWVTHDRCVAISSQAYLNTLSAFRSQYLGVRDYHNVNSPYTTVRGAWVVFGGRAPYHLEYPGSAFPMTVILNGLGHPTFALENDTPAGAMRDAEHFRAAYWGFPLEAITDAAARETVLRDFLGWCANGVAYGSVSGMVNDGDYVHPVTGLIHAEDGPRQFDFKARADGRYTGDLPVGVYTLTASAEHYAPATAPITITPRGAHSQNFALFGVSLFRDRATISQTAQLGQVVTTTVQLTTSGPLALTAAAQPYLTLDKRLYGVYSDWNTNQFYFAHFHANTPHDLTPVSRSEVGFMAAGDFYGDDLTQLYAIATNDPFRLDDEQLVRIDTTTGALTVVGTLPPAPLGEEYAAMAYNPADGKLYLTSTLCDFFFASNTLYTIDPLTAQVTQLGSLSALDKLCVASLAFDDQGVLYAHDALFSSLLTINLATRFATPVAALDVSAYAGSGMDWDPVSGQLLWAMFNDNTQAAELRAIDRAIGQTTLLGGIGPDPSHTFLGFLAVASSPVNWIHLEPTHINLPVNGALNLTVSLDTRSFYQLKDYHAQIGFGGSYVNPFPDLPVTLNVHCATCGVISGGVKDARTNEAVQATVRVTDTNGADFTLRGVDHFDLAALPVPHTLIASAPGYFDLRLPLTVTTNLTRFVELALIPQIGELRHATLTLSETLNTGEQVTHAINLSNTGTVTTTFGVRLENQRLPGANAPVALRAYGLQSAGSNSARLIGFDPTNLLDASVSPLKHNHDLLAGDFWGEDFSTLYAYEESRLVSFNTATGEKRTIGALPYPSEDYWNYTGMAYDPVSQQMYATITQCSFNGSGLTDLLIVNVQTAQTTLVERVSGAGCVRDIAFSDAGALYGSDAASDSIVQINPQTAQATIIGPLGFDLATFASSMDWDSATDQLYMFGFNMLDGSFGNQGLYRVNLRSGAATRLGDMIPGVGGLAMANASPRWVDLPTQAITLPASEQTEVHLTLNAARLSRPGLYRADLVFAGDFANTPPSIPLTLVVECATCASLHGTITDARSAQALPATLSVQGDNGFNAHLYDQSAFDLTLRPGVYTLTVASAEHYSQTATVTLTGTGSVEQDFALIPIFQEMRAAVSSVKALVASNTSLTYTLVLTNTGSTPFEYTVSSVGEALASSIPLTSCGAADSFGYACIDSQVVGGPSYQWQDISSTGHNLGLTGMNDYYHAIRLPFAFSFYTHTYTEVAVSSYGQIFFTDDYPDTDFYHRALPSLVNGTNQFIVPFWSSLDYLSANPSQVFYQLQGQAPRRRLVIQWDKVQRDGSAITFQAILLEGSNNILFQYQSLNGVKADNATVGLQGSAEVGLQYAYNEPKLADGLAICFVYPSSTVEGCALQAPAGPSWLNIVNPNGTIPVNEAVALTFTFAMPADLAAPSALAPGTTFTSTVYIGNLVGAPLIVPVAMQVPHQVFVPLVLK